MKTSRQRVFEYIRAQRVVTAVDVSRALQMTGANARHHLGVLESEGLISQVGTRPGRGKGRPQKLFGIAEPILGNNLDQLARAMLDLYVQNLEEVERAKVFSQLAERLFTNVFIEQPAVTAPVIAERHAMATHPTQRL